MGWLSAGRIRGRVGVVTAVCVALVVSGLSLSPAAADPEEVPADWAPKPQVWKKLPNDPIAEGGDAAIADPEPMTQPGEAEPIEPTTVTVAPEPGGKFTQAADTPISVQADDPVAVEVFSAEETPTEQFAVAFEVAPESAEPVDVEVDVAELQEAGLVDDLDRVALVELPACYAETPDRQECAVPVRTLTSGTDESGKLTATAVTTAASLLAVAATPAGESGSFAAQPLAASSTWSSGSSTGEFNWSYPIAVPDLSLQAAIAPTVALNYNSGAVDGRIASSNNQPGLIGQGWSYEAGFIERRYLTCDDLPDVPTTAKGKGDLCWAGHALFSNFGDRSSEIVRDDTSGQYRLKNDDGRASLARSRFIQGLRRSLTTFLLETEDIGMQGAQKSCAFQRRSKLELTLPGER